MRKLILSLLLALTPFATHAQTISHWVQLGPGGTAELRVLAGGACPQAIVDGHDVALQSRAEAD
ncbi:MAG TPA: hypothetical protein VGM36_14560, partial [Rhizomicrobium sp.]